ncbi:hypothetical protein ACQR1I_28000 [Bradyrhizobium sp. HKCCYLS2038]|uniref:hypothetical protein n=1 Tax=unclassified Bradyrhizobium TaxID=2631580 RepID=UPI003EBD7907
MTIDPITFVDQSSGDDACVLVRVVGGAVGLALSLRRSGDLEVLMQADELDQLIAALQRARSALRAG